MTINFNSLKEQIKTAAKNAFVENVAHYGAEVCSFALVSDDGAMTVVPYTNTLLHLHKMQQEDPEDKEVYEFEPAEWCTSDGANEEVNKLCEILNSGALRKSSTNFEEFKNELFETCVEVLEELRQEGFFTNTLQKDILILFSISDTDEPKENLLDWARRINVPAIFKDYEAYMHQAWS